MMMQLVTQAMKVIAHIHLQDLTVMALLQMVTLKIVLEEFSPIVTYHG
jgi:hypothetical protein